jgi:hypothetical protein
MSDHVGTTLAGMRAVEHCPVADATRREIPMAIEVSVE